MGAFTTPFHLHPPSQLSWPLSHPRACPVRTYILSHSLSTTNFCLRSHVCFSGKVSWSLRLIEKLLLLTLLFIKHIHILINYLCDDPVSGYHHLWSVTSRTGTSFILLRIVLQASKTPNIHYRRHLLNACWMNKWMDFLVTVHSRANGYKTNTQRTMLMLSYPYRNEYILIGMIQRWVHRYCSLFIKGVKI